MIKQVQDVAGWLAAVVAGLAAVAWILRGGWRMSKRVHRLVAELLGDPEQQRPGVADRLDGVDGKLKAIEAELHPNGGGSMRDSVNRTESEIGAVRADVASLRAEFAAHLAEHARSPVTLNFNQQAPASAGE